MTASERAQLRALQRQLEAAHAQVLALLGEAADPDEEEPRCPKCNGVEFIEADPETVVCCGCSANIRNGEVVDG